MADAYRLLAGWGGTPRSGARVTRPWSAAGVTLAGSGARGVLARGLGRSYGDAAQNGGGLVVDMTALEGCEVDSASGVVRAEAGASLGGLLAATVPQGWFLPVVPGTRHVTVGGAIAADIHGKNHHGEGSFGDHVRSLRLQKADDEVVELSSDADPEGFRATIGGMGLTGIVLGAELSLLAIETAYVAVDTDRCDDLDDVMARMREGDAGYRYSVAWIDLVAGRRLGRSVLTRGDHAPRAALHGRRAADPLRYRTPTRLAVPPVVPQGILNRFSVAAFNELWFRKAPRRERGRLQTIPGFFHPLDGVSGWNRLYGSRGFLQYQFAVPDEAAEVVREVVAGLSAARCPSFLGVLKRFGPGRGLLSFPIAGWTLAVDIPVGAPGLSGLLRRCDEAVAGAGGRVYLAKDSRLDPLTLRSMYPELDRWKAIRGRLDPDGVLCSDLARRLELVP